MKHKYKPGAKFYCTCMDCYDEITGINESEVYVVCKQYEDNSCLVIWENEPNSDFIMLNTYIQLI